MIQRGDNHAIIGVAEAFSMKGNHVITSQIEHPAVSEMCAYLQKNDFEITYLPVNEYGLVNLSDVAAANRSRTLVITIMHANNEVGTIQPLQRCQVSTPHEPFPVSVCVSMKKG